MAGRKRRRISTVGRRCWGSSGVFTVGCEIELSFVLFVNAWIRSFTWMCVQFFLSLSSPSSPPPLLFNTQAASASIHPIDMERSYLSLTAFFFFCSFFSFFFPTRIWLGQKNKRKTRKKFFFFHLIWSGAEERRVQVEDCTVYLFLFLPNKLRFTISFTSQSMPQRLDFPKISLMLSIDLFFFLFFPFLFFAWQRIRMRCKREESEEDMYVMCVSYI